MFAYDIDAAALFYAGYQRVGEPTPLARHLSIIIVQQQSRG
jgi:hypothetical protein